MYPEVAEFQKQIHFPLPESRLFEWLDIFAQICRCELAITDDQNRIISRTPDFQYEEVIEYPGDGPLQSADMTLTGMEDTPVKLWAECPQGLPNCATRLAAALENILNQEISHEQEMESMSQEILARYEEVNLFYELSEELASVFDEKRIIDIILSKAKEILLADAALVYLRDEAKEDLCLFAKYCPLNRNNPRLQEDVKTLAEWCYEEQQSILVESISDLPQIAQEFDKFYAFQNEQDFTALISPIHIRENQLGVFAALRVQEYEPFNGQDNRLMSALSSMMAVSLHTSQLLEKAKQEELARKEIEIASAIQQSLLPRETPRIAGIDLASKYIAANKVGGDYLDYLTDEKGNLYFVVADVSGHNIGSAIIMSSCRSVIRMSMFQGKKPAEILQLANRVLYPDLDRSESFLSAIVGYLDVSAGEVLLANAGHNPALVWRAHSREVEWLMSDTFFIGLESNLDVENKRVKLHENDLLLLYTDGLVEATNAQGERYENDRLAQLIEALAELSARNIIERLSDDVKRFMGRNFFDDDISALILKRVD